MKTLTKLLCFAMIMTTASVQASALFNNSHYSLKQNEERQIRNFNGVAVSGSIKAIVKIGTEERIRLEGDPDAIAQLITEVKDGILIIRPKTKWMDWNRKFNNTKITAYITAKRLSSLTMSGSGSIEVQNPVVETELSATLSGSGNIKVTAEVKSFNAVISGSGNIVVSGKANEANITINGSGSVKGTALSVAVASTTISGSGSIYVNATKKINAVTSGSGSVYYSGNPSVDKTVIGSGGVRRN